MSPCFEDRKSCVSVPVMPLWMLSLGQTALLLRDWTSMCANWEWSLAIIKSRVGHNIPTNHNSKVIPSTGAAEVKGWGALQKSCRCRPRGPQKSSHSVLPLPCLLPHPSFPSQCLLAGLVIFQIPKESYFFRKLSLIFQTQSLLTLMATSNLLTFSVHIPCLTGRFMRLSIRSVWFTAWPMADGFKYSWVN